MNCAEVKQMLNAYLDKELDVIETQRMAEHLAACAGCSTEYHALLQVADKIQSAKPRYETPVYLQQRLDKRLRASENQTRDGFFLPAIWVYSLLSLIIGVVIGWSIMGYDTERQIQNNFIETVAAAHIRSLLADHITDVASYDSHTVKPWFHGRLNFSPGVQDLSAQGYPLIGGRLDYLGENTVAALVYRHRQHTINLFIAPQQLISDQIETSTYQGYNIMHWNDGQFSYWAISDLNSIELKQFKQLL